MRNKIEAIVAAADRELSQLVEYTDFHVAQLAPVTGSEKIGGRTGSLISFDVFKRISQPYNYVKVVLRGGTKRILPRGSTELQALLLTEKVENYQFYSRTHFIEHGFGPVITVG